MACHSSPSGLAGRPRPALPAPGCSGPSPMSAAAKRRVRRLTLAFFDGQRSLGDVPGMLPASPRTPPCRSLVARDASPSKCDQSGRAPASAVGDRAPLSCAEPCDVSLNAAEFPCGDVKRSVGDSEGACASSDRGSSSGVQCALGAPTAVPASPFLANPIDFVYDVGRIEVGRDGDLGFKEWLEACERTVADACYEWTRLFGVNAHEAGTEVFCTLEGGSFVLVRGPARSARGGGRLSERSESEEDDYSFEGSASSDGS